MFGIKEKTVFCGEHVPAVAGELRELLDEKAIMPTPAAQVRRAGFLVELGQKQLEAGRQDNPSTLQPLYLRRPQITTPRRPMTILGGEKNDKLASNTA